jgi:hypothetical protein
VKKRTRTHPTNPFYSNEPAVSTGMIADKPPVQSASLGNQTPKMVPKHPGKISGFGGAGAKRPKEKGFKAPTVGAPAKPKSSTKIPTLKSSGHPGAHRIGQLKPLKKI